MKIQKTYKDKPQEHEIVTLKECIEKTENRGHYYKGTVEALLLAKREIITPYAIYENVE